MKKFLPILLLAPLVACASTTAGYETARSFPVDATTLNVNIDYARTPVTATANQMTILGIIKIGSTKHAYAASSPMLALPFIGGDSVESAAVYNALEESKADVLGYPVFRKSTMDYFIFKNETVAVKGYPGVVSR